MTARPLRNGSKIGLRNAMLNALENIRDNPAAKSFDIGELLFAQFDCPSQEDSIGFWAQTDFLVNVLTAEATWKTSTGIVSAKAGQTMFFKKGAYI